MQEENTLIPDTRQEGEPLINPDRKQTLEKETKKSFFVFNFNTLMIILLLAGLGVLYGLHFCGAGGDSQAGPAAFQKDGSRAASMVYINLDTLNAHYEFVKTLRSDLEATGKRLQDEILAEQAAFEKEAAQFQQQVQSNALTEARAKVVYEKLMEKQQALMEKKEIYTQQVAEKEISMNMTLVDTVVNFLKRYNLRYGYDYIIGYKSGGDLLVGNDSLNITTTVLDALNKEYLERK